MELRAFIGPSKTGDGSFEGFVRAWREGLIILSGDLIDARILHRRNNGIANIVDFEVRTARTYGAHAGVMGVKRGFDGQSTDDADVIFEGQKRGQSIIGRNVPVEADGLGCPGGQMNAIAKKPKTKTSRDFVAGGHGVAVVVEHEIQEGQTYGNSCASEHAAQEETPRRLNVEFRFHGCTSFVVFVAFVTGGLARRYPSFVTRAKTSCLNE